MDNEIKQEFENIWKRIQRLENCLCTQDKTNSKISSSKKSPKGLPAGILTLINEGFFDSPKIIAQIIEELERIGYFARRDTVNCTVRRFFKDKKILTRIKQNKTWAYVIKK